MKLKTLQQFANSVARRNGHGRATKVVIGDKTKIVDWTSYGYRKYTTGEYVPNKYLANFGWKNTYYQNAECTVMVSRKDAEKCSDLLPL